MADGGAAETRQAIAAAEDAFHTWRFRPAGERAALLEHWYDLMLERISRTSPAS